MDLENPETIVTHLFSRLTAVLRALLPEVAAAVLRLLLLLLLLLLYLLRALWALLQRLREGHEGAGERKPERCNQVPEHIKRKPDPCLYSQFYLRAQGLSVTWDNPDIWIERLDGTPVPSSDLAANTEYVVNVQIHNASFDAALGTEVRCFYRPWSFNHPDTTPIETNPDGTEKVVLLHIGPWGSEVATFRWTTPDVEQGHYCIRASCYHPDDKNPNNNLGQENTNVRRGTAGAEMVTRAFLMNRTGEAQDIRVEVDQYRIPDGEVELGLKSRSFPLRRKRPFDLLHRAMVSYDSGERSLKTQTRYAPAVLRYAYTGWESARKGSRRQEALSGHPWRPTLEGREMREGRGVVRLDAGEGREVALAVTPPGDAEPGTRHVFNWAAYNSVGKPLGGITLAIEL